MQATLIKLRNFPMCIERTGPRRREQEGSGREEGQGTCEVGVHTWSGEFINKRTILQICSNALCLKWFKTQTWAFSSVIGHMLCIKHHGITLCFNVASSTATANKYNVFSHFTFLHLYNLSEFTYQNSKSLRKWIVNVCFKLAIFTLSSLMQLVEIYK